MTTRSASAFAAISLLAALSGANICGQDLDPAAVPLKLTPFIDDDAEEPIGAIDPAVEPPTQNDSIPPTQNDGAMTADATADSLPVPYYPDTGAPAYQPRDFTPQGVQWRDDVQRWSVDAHQGYAIRDYNYDYGYRPRRWPLLGGAAFCTQNWDGAVDFGLNGSGGNSEYLTAYLGIDACRPCGEGVLSIDLDTFYANNSGEVSENSAFLLGRYEAPLSDGRFGWFLDSWFEYDQFRGFDFRLAFHTGLSATLLNTGGHELTGRLGLGASRAFGGPEEEWAPEIMAGIDYTRHLTKHQRFTFSGYYYPDIADFGDFRLNMTAEYIVDIRENFCFVFSAFDRIDATPNAGRNCNDIDYAIALRWGF